MQHTSKQTAKVVREHSEKYSTVSFGWPDFSLKGKLSKPSATKLQTPLTSFNVLEPQTRETMLGSQLLPVVLNTTNNPL